MGKIFAAGLFIFALGSAAFAQGVTKEQCDHDYDSCKKKHLFDKKPCQKRRDTCFAQLAAQTTAVQKQDTKNRMMNGVTNQPAAGTSMRDRVGGAPAPAVGGGTSMRDRVGGAPAPVTETDQKAAAAARLRERQRAQNGGQNDGALNIRKSVQSN